MEKVFFTSDLRIGHANAIRFDNRPFSGVEEMDAELICRWNAKLGKGDTVYVLGDMIWKSRRAVFLRDFQSSIMAHMPRSLRIS